MEEASQQSSLQSASQLLSRRPAQQNPRDDEALPKLVLHFAVNPAVTVTWRVTADAELRVHSERIWLTRIRSPYDYWMKAGETMRLQRGERIWLSTDSHEAARVSLTSAWRAPRTVLARFSGLFAGLFRVFAT
ncbi:DUF2917 domain-containing protein [Paraburkholderia sp. A1RI_3L]|uniref:DUF2917 domain-containing protein n=1 Tax=Paraburkholderia TaxID=1822464 RepID=UPI0039A72CF4